MVPDATAIAGAAGDSSSVVLLVAGESGAAQEAVTTLRGNGATAAVLPVRSPVQALAAVAVHDPEVDFADAVVAMAEAAAATRCGEIRRSAEAAPDQRRAVQAG